MYGKFFASTFTGSMYGAGATVFAVWGYVIANAVDGHVELNPRSLAHTLGADVADVVSAVAYLCAPDPGSRSAEHEGRRLVQVGAYAYEVVNHAHYRAIRDEPARRAYNAEAQRRHRATKAQSGGTVTSDDVKRSVNPSTSLSAQAEAEADAEAENRTPDAARASAHAHAPAQAREGSAASGVPAGSVIASVTLTDDERAAVIRATAREWTFAANEGMHDNPATRDSYRPITVGRGDSLDVVETAFAAGVRPTPIARAIVYEMARQFRPAKLGDSISSLAYFRDRLVDIYGREVARHAAAVTHPVPVDLTPTRATAGGARRTYADEAREVRQREAGVGAAAAADSLGLGDE